jgi:hypothetical protein
MVLNHFWEQDIVIYGLYLAFLFASAYIDDEHVEDGDYIEDHKSRVFLRGVVTLGFCVDMDCIIGVDVAMFILLCSTWASLFDGAYNSFSDNKWFHLGKTAYWDLFWRDRMKMYYVFKVAVVILAAIVYKLIKF